MEPIESSAQSGMRNGPWKAISIVSIAVIVVMAVFIGDRFVRANADYICTHIVEQNDPCGNGSWGDWQLVSESGDPAQCTRQVVERRVYTGTRVVRHILQYLNLRTACVSGYEQEQSGSGGGASGFHGGTVVSQTAICQIEEVRTQRGLDAGNNMTACANVATSTLTTTVEQTASDIEFSSNSDDVSSLDELQEFRASMIAADITAIPLLVNNGDTTQVRWQSRETTECTVDGSNGDHWTGTSGEQTSSPLTQQTTYTLNCVAFNGTQVSDDVTVGLAPVWNEQ